jgi:hypothetical protein
MLELPSRVAGAKADIVSMQSIKFGHALRLVFDTAADRNAF